MRTAIGQGSGLDEILLLPRRTFLSLSPSAVK